MKVLHLGANIAFGMTSAIESLRSIGIDCRGVVDTGVTSYDSERGVTALPAWYARSDPRWLPSHVRRYWTLLSAIRWADLLHWYFGVPMLPHDRALRWARFLGKPGIVEFCGSDIRIAEVEDRDDPYFAKYWPEKYRRIETYEHSREMQERFSRAGFACLTHRSLLPSVQPDLFPNPHLKRHRVPVKRLVPAYPEPVKSRPLVVHCPSDGVVKGTSFITAAVDRLKARIDFDFRLVQGVPHAEVLAHMRECDVFIDQLLAGDHGTAAVEAMALGKPVVCYIRPSVAARLPPELPIVNANVDSFEQVLETLLHGGERRQELGRLGRTYVERYHDADLLARELEHLYRTVLADAKGRGTATSSHSSS